VAEVLAVSTRTVRRWISSGQLKVHRVGQVVRIAPAEFDAFLCQHRDA
jgi:excisionase family DNA binding protein